MSYVIIGTENNSTAIGLNFKMTIFPKVTAQIFIILILIFQMGCAQKEIDRPYDKIKKNISTRDHLSTPEKTVTSVSLEGTVGYLGEHNKFKDYFKTVIDEEIYGIKGKYHSVEEKITELRDSDKIVKVTGRLVSPAEDFNKKQIVVNKIEFDYKIKEASPEVISELQHKMLEFAVLNKPLLDKKKNKHFADSGFGFFSDQATIFVLNKNLSSSKLTIYGKKVVILSESQIKQRTEEPGEFSFFVFDDVISRENKVLISLEFIEQKTEKSKAKYLSGAGTEVVFEKIDGQWLIVKPIEIGIS